MLRFPRTLIVGNFLSETGKTTLQACEKLFECFDREGARPLCTSNKVSKSLRLIDMLFTVLIQNPNYDVALINVFSGPAYRWAELTGYLINKLNKPFVLVLHGGDLPAFAQKNEKRVKKLFNQAARIVSPSTYLALKLSWIHKNIEVIPNIVNLGHFHYKKRRSIRPRLLWARAFSEEYNPLMAINVYDYLRGKYDDATLTMCGPDKGYEKKVRETLDQVTARDGIQLIGHIANDHMPKIADKCDIFINTTTVDNAPVSLIEAMSMGLPIVSTNVGGIPHLLQDGKDCLLVKNGDAHEMAAACERLINTPELVEKLTYAALVNTQQFSWDESGPKWSRLLNDVVRRSMH